MLQRVEGGWIELGMAEFVLVLQGALSREESDLLSGLGLPPACVTFNLMVCTIRNN